jgi:hypothetical protein
VPITVGYEPVAAAGGAAILAGQGQYARWLAQQQQEAALQNQRIQAQSDMQRASLSAEAQRQQAQFGQQSKMADAEFGQRKDLLGIGQQNDLAKMEAQHGYHSQDLKDENQLAIDKLKASMTEQKGLYDYELSAADKQKMDKIDTALSYVQNSPDYTDEERQYAVSQLQAQKAGVNPKAVPINLQEHYAKNSITLPDGSVVYRDPNGQIHDFKPTQPKSANQDKFNDPRVLHSIVKDVEGEVRNEGAIDPVEDPEAYQNEIDTRVQRRLATMKKLAGRDVADAQQFDPNMRTWSQEQMDAARAAQPGDMLKAARKAFVPGAPPSDEFQQQAPAAAPRGVPPDEPAASPQPDSDPIAKMYPPDIAAQVNSQITALTQQLLLAKKGGDPQAVSAAKAQLSDFLQQHLPKDSGAPAVAPPSAPIIPPPPAPAKARSMNTMTVKGKTVSKER